MAITAKLCGDLKRENQNLSLKKVGLDVITHRSLTESSAQVLLLDILSHRMSAIAIFRQLT